MYCPQQPLKLFSAAPRATDHRLLTSPGFSLKRESALNYRQATLQSDIFEGNFIHLHISKRCLKVPSLCSEAIFKVSWWLYHVRAFHPEGQWYLQSQLNSFHLKWTLFWWLEFITFDTHIKLLMTSYYYLLSYSFLKFNLTNSILYLGRGGCESCSPGSDIFSRYCSQCTTEATWNQIQDLGHMVWQLHARAPPCPGHSSSVALEAQFLIWTMTQNSCFWTYDKFKRTWYEVFTTLNKWKVRQASVQVLIDKPENSSHESPHHTLFPSLSFTEQVFIY